MDNDINEVIEESKISSPDKLWKACISKLSEYGVSSVFYGIIPIKGEVERIGLTKSCFYKTNHSQRWIDAIGEENLIEDEVSFEDIIDRSETIFWNDPKIWASASDQQNIRYEIERSVGMGLGVTIGLANAIDDRITAGVGLSLAAVSEKDIPRYWQEYGGKIEKIANIVDVCYRMNVPNDLVELTVKEIEILKMSFAGYTKKEICRKNGVSQGTMEFHSRNIRKKLRSQSVEHGALKAILLGIIRS